MFGICPFDLLILQERTNVSLFYRIPVDLTTNDFTHSFFWQLYKMKSVMKNSDDVRNDVD